MPVGTDQGVLVDRLTSGPVGRLAREAREAKILCKGANAAAPRAKVQKLESGFRVAGVNPIVKTYYAPPKRRA